MDVASASFRISILSILERFRVFKGSNPVKLVNPLKLYMGLEFMGRPSMIYKGRLPLSSKALRRLFCPLILMLVAVPGIALCTTSTPAMRP